MTHITDTAVVKPYGSHNFIEEYFKFDRELLTDLPGVKGISVWLPPAKGGRKMAVENREYNCFSPFGRALAARPKLGIYLI